MLKLIKLISALLITFTAAAIGSFATISNIPGWYEALNKPSFNPPNWVFGPVWTLLYLLIAVSLYIVWIARYRDSKKAAFILFGLQLALNTLWSLVFFGIHELYLSIAIILALFFLILATIRLFWPISRKAACLLIPYAAWVGFASVLNIAIATLN